MKPILRKAWVLLVTYYAHMLEYRAEIFFWALSGSLPLILMGVWMEASVEGQFGLGPVDFARYFLAVFIIRQFTLVWMIFDFEQQVVRGQLSPRLLQPMNPLWHHVAAHLAERVARLPFALVLIGLFFVLYPQAIWLPSLGTLLLFSVVTVMVFILRFLIQSTLAMFAFWTERASALEQFQFLFYLFLSGYLAPLEMFPPLIREIVLWTPFPYLIHFPALILIGLPVNLPRGILTMVGWTIVFYGWYRWLWQRGLKHYSGMGA